MKAKLINRRDYVFLPDVKLHHKKNSLNDYKIIDGKANHI